MRSDVLEALRPLAEQRFRELEQEIALLREAFPDLGVISTDANERALARRLARTMRSTLESHQRNPAAELARALQGAEAVTDLGPVKRSRKAARALKVGRQFLRAKNKRIKTPDDLRRLRERERTKLATVAPPKSAASQKAYNQLVEQYGAAVVQQVVDSIRDFSAQEYKRPSDAAKMRALKLVDVVTKAGIPPTHPTITAFYRDYFRWGNRPLAQSQRFGHATLKADNTWHVTAAGMQRLLDATRV